MKLVNLKLFPPKLFKNRTKQEQQNNIPHSFYTVAREGKTRLRKDPSKKDRDQRQGGTYKEQQTDREIDGWAPGGC